MEVSTHHREVRKALDVCPQGPDGNDHQCACSLSGSELFTGISLTVGKTDLPHKVTYSQVPGLRTWTSLWDHYSATTVLKPSL